MPYTHTINIRRIPSTDPRLKRHVAHDSRSLAYPLTNPEPVRLSSWRHASTIPILDQGDEGSCTGNASVKAASCDPFFATLTAALAKLGAILDESFAKTVYHLATTLDAFPGQMPPTDTGSDGTGVAKAMKQLGLISGYEHALGTTTQAIDAGRTRPPIIGINWYDSFYTPSPEGVISISKGSKVAGGHELCWDEYDDTRGLIGGPNSWGATWGMQGRWLMEVETLDRLRTEDGDITVFTPLNTPAPTPQPVPTDTDLTALIAGTYQWLTSSPLYFGTSRARKAVNAYLAKKAGIRGVL